MLKQFRQDFLKLLNAPNDMLPFIAAWCFMGGAVARMLWAVTFDAEFKIAAILLNSAGATVACVLVIFVWRIFAQVVGEHPEKKDAD